MLRTCSLILFFLCVPLLADRSPPINVVVRISNMTESMNNDAIRLTKQAFVTFNGYSSKSRANLTSYIRWQFEKRYPPSWQCIIGRDFALSIASENERRVILDVGKVAVLLFQGKC